MLDELRFEGAWKWMALASVLATVLAILLPYPTNPGPQILPFPERFFSHNTGEFVFPSAVPYYLSKILFHAVMTGMCWAWLSGSGVDVLDPFQNMDSLLSKSPGPAWVALVFAMEFGWFESLCFRPKAFLDLPRYLKGTYVDLVVNPGRRQGTAVKIHHAASLITLYLRSSNGHIFLPETPNSTDSSGVPSFFPLPSWISGHHRTALLMVFYVDLGDVGIYVVKLVRFQTRIFEKLSNFF